LVDTGQETMTGGRIRRVQRYVDESTFMVTYGDGLADVNVARLLDFHRSHGRVATVTTVKPTSRFGMLALSPESQVTDFTEKPQIDGWISAGFFVFERRVFDYIDGDDACILEKSPMERLARDGQLMAYRHEGCFHAMDTYRDYQHLNALWDSGQASWKVW
jgi:glucose-1-phosphate cytidylyltransferase